MARATKGPRTAGDLGVRMLSATRKVIPLYYMCGTDWHTDVKLPHLVLTNASGEEATLRGLSLVLTAGGEEVARFTCGREPVKQSIGATNELLNQMIRGRPGPWRENNLHLVFAAEPPPGDTYEESLPLKPSSKTCLSLDDLFVCHYAGQAKADGIVCRILATVGGRDATVEFPVPLTPYECKGEYSFPLRGTLTISGTPWNRAEGHRGATNQVFAFDVEDLRRGDDGVFAASSPPDSHCVDDYFLFNREVRAIGDGVVVGCGNEWTDELLWDPHDYSIDKVVEETERMLAEGVPFEHALLGNYAIIDHENGEFSVYAHMRQGLVSVSPGDRVRRGQVIGRVGNTSSSTAPHLHFHLMDGPNVNRANGLPVRFIDLPTEEASDGTYRHADAVGREANPLLYSDHIYVRVPG